MEDKMKNNIKMAILALIGISTAQGMDEPLARQSDQFTYKSRFTPPCKSSTEILTKGQVLAPGETPEAMIERVVNTLSTAEIIYNLKAEKSKPTAQFAQELGRLMDEKYIVLSTPILMNAGRFIDRPLSACVMPPVDLKADFKKVKKIVDQYHQDGMGTGYNLDDVPDPVGMLKALNKLAVEGAKSQKEQRPVGNMAILSVNSPAIQEFINAKVGADERGEDWKFNISVDISDEFMNAVEQDLPFSLNNGAQVNAKDLLNQMANAAHKCGDPGLISIKRLNDDNPTPSVGEYKCTAPCAEVGLAPGETCVFGYINLANLVENNAAVNFDKLKYIITLLTRALDDILEISIQKYSINESKSVMQAKRKIGIGICGFADMLLKLNISYASNHARDLLHDILNFISYHSKVTSTELAKFRGSFTEISKSKFMDESFIMRKYGQHNTPHVSALQWQQLATYIKETKLLRNATTSALPPTGRSATIIGASQSLEPIFSFYHPTDGIHPLLQEYLARNSLAENKSLLEEIKKTGVLADSPIHKAHPFITATQLNPSDHIQMIIVAQKAIDESISKTVNLPEETTPEEIALIYRQAYAAGLKGISIYRDNSRFYQPKNLSVTKNENKN